MNANPLFSISMDIMREKPQKETIIALGSDHGGWELKEHIRDFLVKGGYSVNDLGCRTPENFDYPAIGIKLARGISDGSLDKGILICGTGIGMSIAANRFSGVRAALCHDTYTARLSREHNDANILVMGGRVTGKGLAEEIVSVWLTTPFLDPDGRHGRRLAQIVNLERELKIKK
jgi:ribose 5-phosphate isomerase B